MKKILSILVVVFIAVGALALLYYKPWIKSNDSAIKAATEERIPLSKELQNAFNTRGQNIFRKDLLKRSIIPMQKAYDLAPGNSPVKESLADAYFQIARIDYDAGENAEALKNIEKSLNIDPAHKGAQKLKEKLQ